MDMFSFSRAGTGPLQRRRPLSTEKFERKNSPLNGSRRSVKTILRIDMEASAKFRGRLHVS